MLAPSPNYVNMASKFSSSSSSSSYSKQRVVPFVLYLIILSLFFLCLIISFNFRPTTSNNCATIRNQQVIKNETKNERKNADWFVAISKLFKIKGRKIKVGLVNVDEHIHSQLHGLSDVEAVSVAFERVARDRKWKDYFPEWIDEDEKWGKPKCPEIPIPKLEHYEGIDVVLAKVPCGPNGTSDREGIRDVFRLQVNLMVANLVVGKRWMKPDAHRTVYVVFIGDCGPMVEIFRCDDLLMHRGNYWVYRPNIGRLKQIVHMPVGSCQVASGYAETGTEIWRKFMLETSSWIPYEKRRLAYVTILHSSEAYVCGAIALARSIRQTNSTKDLVLLADDFITPKSIQGLTAAGWKIKRIQRIRSAFAKKGSYNEWNYSKLRVWQLTEYDKAIFIDADLLVLKNIDSFFVHQQLSAVGNNRVLFNSGLMVVEPSNCMFEYLMQKTSKLESYNGGDQGFLNEIFTWWHRLPWRLNALKCFDGSKGTTKSHPPIPEHLSFEAKDFLLKCLQKEPHLRSVASELLQHPFVTGQNMESDPVFRTSVMEDLEFRSPSYSPNLHTFEMSTCPDSDDMCNMGSLQHSTIHPNKLLESRAIWGRNSNDDDMCQIDDKDDTMVGEVKLSSSLMPDNIKSFNPMCEPTDDELVCKFGGSLETKQNGMDLGLDINHQTDFPAGNSGTIGEGEKDFSFPCGTSLAEEDDILTESKITAFLDEKALELKKLQTPLFEEFYNSLNVICSPNFVDNLPDEPTSRYLKLPPKSRSPSRGVADALSTGSPGSNGRRVSIIGNANVQTAHDMPSPPCSQQEPGSPSMSSSERERKWKEELDLELARKREMMRQAGVGGKTLSPKDRGLNRQRERTRFASPGK
ncbi:hypothetical protein C1H46_036058 [Malus baccata]|uniref:Protein kinase domain-containing protein n=1 Tax=Malus baccata TaxID=106549 RepID=A0A540KVU7_MALBA|nr:hypothetical protein C1H46_036058 [Malus baccata]